MEFCIGDRVRATSKSLIIKVGESNIGTVALIDASSHIGVIWDEDFGGHSLQEHCKRGHGWWCFPQTLALVEAEEDNDYVLVPATDEELSFLYS